MEIYALVLFLETGEIVEDSKPTLTRTECATMARKGSSYQETEDGIFVEFPPDIWWREDGHKVLVVGAACVMSLEG